MPRRLYSNFPKVFETITDVAIKRMETGRRSEPSLIQIPCKTKNQAMNLMMQMRQYWKSLQEERAKGRWSHFDVEYLRAVNAGQLSCLIKASTNTTLTVLHKDQLETSQAMYAAIDAIEGVLGREAPMTAHANPQVIDALRDLDSSGAFKGSAQDQLLDAIYPRAAGPVDHTSGGVSPLANPSSDEPPKPRS